MLRVSKEVEEYCDGIDINLGCPQEIARKGKYGAYLQEDWDLTSEIIKTVSQGIKKPVCCKIRITDNIIEYVKMIEKSGCKFLVVHGRTREQRGRDTGLADWEIIRQIKEAVKIPVIANGNILEYEDIRRCIEYTKCDGVMVGEPHLYNPTLLDCSGSCSGSYSFLPSQSPSVHPKGQTRSQDSHPTPMYPTLQSHPTPMHPSSLSSLVILREYLEICKENKTNLRNIKSHCFKLLYTFFQFFPDLRGGLEECKSLEEYLEYEMRISKMEISDEDIRKGCLELRPYIRGERVFYDPTTTSQSPE